MKKERVLITVKTYPTLSSTYGELVCTAGIRASTKEWVRIYPVPYRRLTPDRHYKKYQWVDIHLVKNPMDPRSESYRPHDAYDITLLEEIPPSYSGWRERRKWVLDSGILFSSTDDMIKFTKEENTSIAVFKPAEILKFHIVPTESEWDPNKLAKCRAMLNQPGLFDGDQIRAVGPVDKIPFKFKIRFADSAGRISDMMVEDWEICSLYRNCFRKTEDMDLACSKVQEKIEDIIEKRELYFILGTTAAWHYISPNPYLIIGLFYPPHETQMSLGL